VAPSPVVPRTTTVPLATVPANGAAPESEEKKPEEKKESEENPRQHVQTPGWLKTVSSDK
jgi:hypothetical protein